MTQSVLESMARAAYEAFIADVADLEPCWDDLAHTGHQERMIEAQRAALIALRDGVTDEAGRIVWWNVTGAIGCPDEGTTAFRAAIDHVLQEREER